MSAYPNQPQSGWPEQPPRDSGGRGYPGGPGYAGGPDYAGGPRYPGGPGAPGRGYPGRAPRRRRRRGRGWIAALAILIVAAAVFAIGDQVARSYAQNEIAAKFKSQGLAVKPDVSIKGWPFLTQVAARDVGTIDISASDFQQDRLDISRLVATASGVHLNSSFSGARIDSINGTIAITYSSVASALGVPGLTITADPSAGPDVVKVSEGPLSTTAQVTKAGPYQVRIQPQSIQGVPVQVPAYTLNLPHFPAGIQLSGVSLTAQGLVVAISAQNATLAR